MVLFSKRPRIVLAAFGLLALAAGAGAWLKVARDVHGALALPSRDRAELRLVRI